MRIQTTDTAGLSFTDQFAITVSPTTAAPTDIALTGSTATAYQTAGATIGTLSTTDPNVSQAFTYAVVAGPNSDLFTISGDKLVTNAVIPANTQTTYDVDVQTTDTAGLSFTKTFTLTVNPTTAAPTNIALSSVLATTYRDSGTTIGTFTTTDPNAGQTWTYSLVSGLNSNLFTIADNTLETAAVFTTPATYSVQVQTTDSAGLSFTKTFTITVTPTPTGPPTLPCPGATATTYQAPGTTIGTLSTTDPNANQAWTYAIVSSPNSKLFAIAGDTLKTAAVFATTTTDNVQVQTTDSAGLSFTKTFTITVSPTTAGPTDIALSKTTTTDYQTAGATIGTFTTTDPNVNQTFTYTIVPGLDGKLFAITGNTLTTNAILTTATTDSVQVQATDSAGLTFTKTFTITINPTTAAPTDVGLSNVQTITYQPVGTTIGSLSTTDPNAGQSWTYTILPGLNGNVFAITGNTLQTAAIYTVPTTYNLLVQTTDTAGLSFTKQLTILVSPTTVAPTDIALSNTTVTTSQPAGTTIGTLSTTDPNAGQSWTYAIVPGLDGNQFTIAGSSLETGKVLAVTTPTTYSVQVQTTDSAGLTFAKTFTITVSPSGPTDIALSNTTVAAFQPVNTAVGTLSTTDTNTGQSWTYTFTWCQQHVVRHPGQQPGDRHHLPGKHADHLQHPGANHRYSGAHPQQDVHPYGQPQQAQAHRHRAESPACSPPKPYPPPWALSAPPTPTSSRPIRTLWWAVRAARITVPSRSAAPAAANRHGHRGYGADGVQHQRPGHRLPGVDL